jgi:phytanoyl-CoA hydroxylase
MDGRPRFDLEPGHSAERPALRRVTSPIEISDAYLDVMRSSKAVDAVAQLIGPNVAFNNAKVNSKQPGAATEVKFHQDFLFEPHTNDDLITVLFFLDEVTIDNGPLEVIPGTHRGPMFDHWHDGVYTGAVSQEVRDAHLSEAVSVVGAAGTACLMHTRLLHGSGPNQSDRPRTLFISEYRAEDSKPLQVNHIPSRYEGEVVRGVATNRVRCSAYEMEYPEVPTGASFFSQQAKAAEN